MTRHDTRGRVRNLLLLVLILALGLFVANRWEAAFDKVWPEAQDATVTLAAAPVAAGVGNNNVLHES